MYYTKSDRYTWNPQYTVYDQKYIDKFYHFVESETGRRYASDNLTASGTREGSSGASWHDINVRAKGIHWKYTIEGLEKLDREGRIIWPNKEGGVPRYKRYLDEMPGVAIQSMITDIPPLSAQSAEKLGYPTQKPLALLERIIKASSNEGPKSQGRATRITHLAILGILYIMCRLRTLCANRTLCAKPVTRLKFLAFLMIARPNKLCPGENLCYRATPHYCDPAAIAKQRPHHHQQPESP